MFMSRLFKLLSVAVLALFVLACGLISNPISDVQGAASTAQAFASAMPVETLESLTTALPVQTIEALPSVLPDVGEYFNPTGTPVGEWNGIPIMPQATVGQEFDEGTYSYTVPVTATDVQSFYNQKMEELGWTSPFGFQATEQGGILIYQKDTDFLTITIVADQDGSDGMDVLLQK
jgi:hypothetical protein